MYIFLGPFLIFYFFKHILLHFSILNVPGRFYLIGNIILLSRNQMVNRTIFLFTGVSGVLFIHYYFCILLGLKFHY